MSKVRSKVSEQFGKNYVFTQDEEPSHTSNLTQKWCKGHFNGFWDKDLWPPSNSYIKPIDFAIWCILKSDVSAKSFKNFEATLDEKLV